MYMVPLYSNGDHMSLNQGSEDLHLPAGEQKVPSIFFENIDPLHPTVQNVAS